MGNILVLGVGEIGAPLLRRIQAKHPGAIGIDIEPRAVEGDVDIMHVCYPFDLPQGFVDVTAAYAEKYRPALIIINSTALPGTSREVAERTGLPVVFSPIRGKHTKMDSELVHYRKFVAGDESAAVERARAHFEGLGMQVQVLGKAETLELAKLYETTYFGLLIAWAQEMDRLAREVGGDYLEAAQFFEEVEYLPRRIFVPGFIGGHCVMPNIALLKRRFSSELLDAVEAANARKAAEVPAEDRAGRERVEPLKVGG